MMNGINSSILHLEEIFYVLQHGLKHRSFSVTDYMLLLLHWHSNRLSDEKVLTFLYTVALRV